MKNYIYLFSLVSLFNIPNVFAGVSLVGGEIQISGVATTDEFQASGGITWNTSSRIYEINNDIRLLNGADVRGINDLIIDMKGHKIYVDSGVVSAEFTDLTILNSVGRNVSDRVWIIDNGGGYISLNGCRYIHNVEGSGPQGRHLDEVYLESLTDTTITGSEFALQEVGATFFSPSRIKNLNLKRGGLLSVIDSRPFLINPTHYSRGSNGGYLGVYNSGSMMLLNYVPDKTLNRDLDNWNSQASNHWVYWLGTSVQNFQRGSNNNSLVITNRNNTLRNVGGGIRYYNFIGGQGATVRVFDGFAGGRAPFLVDQTRADMLNTTLDYILPVSENVEIVTRAFRYGGDTSWVYTPITGQTISVAKYEKELLAIDVSIDPTAVVGTDESYAPILINDDTFITETNQATVDAYTSIDNLDQLYDRAKSWKVEMANIEYPTVGTQPVAANGSELDLGNRNLVVDGDSTFTSTSLGIESGSHSLSSNYAGADGTSPNNARLNNPWGFVIHPSHKSNDGYVQVDLGTVKKISRIATQGSANPARNYWTTSYRLTYNDGSGWQDYNSGEILNGNTNRTGIVNNELIPFEARYIRVIPISSVSQAALRIALYETTDSAFVVNKATDMLTIKASDLIAGSKFSNLKTTGTISTTNTPSLEVGYQDSTGIYKYISLSNLTNADILIRDNATSPATTIVSVTNITGVYKAHFLAPTDASDTEVVISRANYSTFQETYPENDLSFVRSINLQLTQLVAESQIEILNLATKILQKEEALYRSLELTNPTINVTNTITGFPGSPSLENQEAILEIMKKVFIKVIANRRKLEE